MRDKIKNILEEYKCLMRSVPGLVIASFFLALICMNILANKTIWTTEHTAADGGILIGWATFLCMDIITIRFGPKASTMVSITAAVQLPRKYIFNSMDRSFLWKGKQL